MARVPLTCPLPVEIVEEPLDTVPSRELGLRHGFARARSTGDRRCGEFLTRPSLTHPFTVLERAGGPVHQRCLDLTTVFTTLLRAPRPTVSAALQDQLH